MAEFWWASGVKLDQIDQPGGAGGEAVVRKPRGTYSSRVDDKGRLKLPVDFEKYLRAVSAKDEGVLFITSFDGKYARIYSSSVWEAQLEVLERPDPDAATGSGLLMEANHYGADCSIDNQARVLIPPDLRKAMGVENQPVRLVCLREHVAVMSEAEYERRRLLREDSHQAVMLYEQKGLK